jgi:hypothetical protein
MSTPQANRDKLEREVEMSPGRQALYILVIVIVLGAVMHLVGVI